MFKSLATIVELKRVQEEVTYPCTQPLAPQKEEIESSIRIFI